MIMIDPKLVELSSYNDIPHLLVPVLTNTIEIGRVLKWVVAEAKSRYEKIQSLAKHNDITIRNIDEFNDIILTHGTPEEIAEYKMPRILIVIDELTQLLMTPEFVNNETKYGGNVTENDLTQTIQFGRAAGINLLAATQNPKAEVINTLMRDNFSTRIAFRATTASASRVILDETGGEVLLGSGDMLYKQEGLPNMLRVQGAYVSSDEIDRIVSNIKKNNNPVTHHPEAELYYNGWMEVYNWFVNRGDNHDEAIKRMGDVVEQAHAQIYGS
jgi:S-DNA-T family DNA segregation ATPase FtsK/SpoIIIE